MPSTSPHAIPYPASTDTPDVPYYMQQLAQGVETAITQDFTQRVELSKSAATSCTTSTDTDIIWETEDYDTDGWHAASSATVTVPDNGIYAVSGAFQWQQAVASTDCRMVYLQANGTEILAECQAPQSSSTNNVHNQASLCWVGYLASGSTLKCIARQNSGSTLTIDAVTGATQTTRLRVVKLPMIF